MMKKKRLKKMQMYITHRGTQEKEETREGKEKEQNKTP